MTAQRSLKIIQTAHPEPKIVGPRDIVSMTLTAPGVDTLYCRADSDAATVGSEFVCVCENSLPQAWRYTTPDALGPASPSRTTTYLWVLTKLSFVYGKSAVITLCRKITYSKYTFVLILRQCTPSKPFRAFIYQYLMGTIWVTEW